MCEKSDREGKIPLFPPLKPSPFLFRFPCLSLFFRLFVCLFVCLYVCLFSMALYALVTQEL